MNYFIQVFGCQMNRSDAERITSLLESLGLKKAESPEKSDLFFAVMCSVRQMAADRVFGLEQKFKQIKKNNPKFKSILTGCVVENDKNRFSKIFDYILNIKTLNKWPLVIGIEARRSKTSAKSQMSCLCETDDYFSILPKQSSKFSALIPISKGCDNYCTYCVVPYTRGPLKSRPAADIIKETRLVAAAGAKEIWLLGQNVNNYHSGKINFARLLRMVDDIEGDFWIRFTSPHPKDFSDEAILAMAQCQKVTPYLNLPLQSGDDEILKEMNRPYDFKTYKNLVVKIRAAFKKYRHGLEKNLALSTDIIVGFPGETKKQFQSSAKAFKTIKYDMAYIAQYSKRAGTVAGKMNDDVFPAEKKHREKSINDILKITALTHNKKYIGKTVEVFVDSLKNTSCGLGKTRSYKTVKFKISSDSADALIGTFVQVKISKAQSFGMEGKMLQQ